MFLNTLGITKYRVQFVMQNFFESGRVPIDRRGGDHKKQKYAALRQSVHRFLNSWNYVEAHYCRGSSQQHKYLPSELNIKKLFQLFKQAHPDTYDTRLIKRQTPDPQLARMWPQRQSEPSHRSVRVYLFSVLSFVLCWLRIANSRRLTIRTWT